MDQGLLDVVVALPILVECEEMKLSRRRADLGISVHVGVRSILPLQNLGSPKSWQEEKWKQ
jgi:hypothetical protein